MAWGRVLSREATIFPSPQTVTGAADWVRLLRPHHWAKNLLVAVPLVTAHRFDAASVALALAAMLALSLAASAAYILNDILDRKADRRHPVKCRRPLAAGHLSVPRAALLSGALAAAALAGSLAVNPAFGAFVAAYLVLSSAYSAILKRWMILDAVILSILYTLRVAAGASAIGVAVSEWLMAFSLFIFSALALAKRQAELARLRADGLPDPAHRPYRRDDLPLLTALAAALGFNAVTVLTLYVSSPSVAALYGQPQVLWLICPVLIYWLGRLLMLGYRGALPDDPIVFALKDPVSLIVLVLIGAVLVAAL